MKRFDRSIPQVMAAVAALLFTAAPVVAENTRYCSQTTRLADVACRNAADAELWKARGICTNVTGDELREECFAEAGEVYAEQRELCMQQQEARDAVCEALGEARYDPFIDPAQFVDPLAIGDIVAPNPYFPLVPGMQRTYQAGAELIEVQVTTDTVTIQGVDCIVLRDTVSSGGELVEDTDDWYAQDINGNVWYFGEIARNYEDGTLTDLDGSWVAGVDGARAGIIMQAMPQLGTLYRQEWALAEAEDMGEVIALDATETAPAASCSGTCLQTLDFTALEPDALEYKFYAPGIGVIVEYRVDTPEDRMELIGFSN